MTYKGRELKGHFVTSFAKISSLLLCYNQDCTSMGVIRLTITLTLMESWPEHSKTNAKTKTIIYTLSSKKRNMDEDYESNKIKNKKYIIQTNKQELTYAQDDDISYRVGNDEQDTGGE